MGKKQNELMEQLIRTSIINMGSRNFFVAVHNAFVLREGAVLEEAGENISCDNLEILYDNIENILDILEEVE